MTDIDSLRTELDGQSPRAILKAALARYDNSPFPSVVRKMWC